MTPPIGTTLRNFLTTEAGEILGASAKYLRVRFSGEITRVSLHQVTRKNNSYWLYAPDDFGGERLGEKLKRKSRKSKPRIPKHDKAAAVCMELGIDRATLERRCEANGLSVEDFCREEAA